MRLTLDASANRLGYILSNVNEDGTKTVLHYGARATTKTERNDSATDLELHMTDFNEMTMTSLNTNNLTAAGQSADNSSGDTTDNVPGMEASLPNDRAMNEPTNETDSTGVSIATQFKDPDFHHIINYLLCGTLPTDDKIARRTLLLSDYHVISDGKLFHLITSRCKNTKLQECLMKQLCIPADR